MMGGIYSMIFLRKPRHTAFQKFNITMHEEGRALHVEQLQAEIGLEDEFGAPSGAKRNPDFSLITEPELHLKEDELPYYILTFKMPLHLCRWGEPMVCQFIEEEVERLEPEVEELTEDPDKKHKKKPKKNRKPNDTPISKPTRSTISKSVTESHVTGDLTPRTKSLNRRPLPARESSLNIFRPSAIDLLRRSASYPSVPAELVKNFYLQQGPLKKKEIQIMQQYCVPLLLSSFKFPQEFRDEALEDEQTHKKPVGPMYRRRLIEPDVEKDATANVYTFNYEDQAKPERMYPIFERTAEMIMEDTELKTVDSQHSHGDDKTLYQLMATLGSIKDKYEENSKKISTQTSPQGVKIPRRLYHADSTVSTSRNDRNERNASKSRRNTSIALTMANRDAPSTSTVALESEKDTETEWGESEIGEGTGARKSRIPALATAVIPMPKKLVETIKVTHWTTEYILESNFDHDLKVLTVKTDRLGDFGFAYPRYIHFPFRNWELDINELK